MYLIKENSLLIFDQPKSWESFSEDNIKKYLIAGYEVFQEKLDRHFEKGEKITAKEEKELKFMLEALIDAKKLLGNK